MSERTRALNALPKHISSLLRRRGTILPMINSESSSGSVFGKKRIHLRVERNFERKSVTIDDNDHDEEPPGQKQYDESLVKMNRGWNQGAISAALRKQSGCDDFDERDRVKMAMLLKHRLGEETRLDANEVTSDDDDDAHARYQRRVQSHELARRNSNSNDGTTTTTCSSFGAANAVVVAAEGFSSLSYFGNGSTATMIRLPPLKGRQQKAMTITGDFIRTAKPKTFECLNIVLEAVAERYEISKEKTVWTKTLWKYISHEWEFHSNSSSSKSSSNENDVLKIIEAVDGRDADEFIELWAKRRKVSFSNSSNDDDDDDDNDNEIMDDDEDEDEDEYSIHEDEEQTLVKGEEKDKDKENEQKISMEIEKIKEKSIFCNPNNKGAILLATARAYDDLGFVQNAKDAWTNCERFYNCDRDANKLVEMKIERLCSSSRNVNRLDDAKQCFLDLVQTIKPKSGLKRKAFTAACKVINQTKDVQFARLVYDAMKRNREHGDAFIIATLISAFGFYGMLNPPTQKEEMKMLGLQCFTRAKTKDIVLDGQCYSSIVGLLCKAGDVENAMEIIKQLEQSEKWMAQGTIGTKAFAAAFKYEQKNAAGKSKNAVSEENEKYYDFQSAKRLQELKKQQFKEIRDNREAKKNRQNVEPAYAQVMHFLTDSKRPKEALMVFQNMQRNGVPPSKSTYRALYKALRYAGGKNGSRVSNKTAARYAIDTVTSNSASNTFSSFGNSKKQQQQLQGTGRRYVTTTTTTTTNKGNSISTSNDYNAKIVSGGDFELEKTKRHDLECILEICARAGLADEAIEIRDRLRFGFGDAYADAPEIRRCLVEAFQRCGPHRVEEALAVYNEDIFFKGSFSKKKSQQRSLNNKRTNAAAVESAHHLSPEFWSFLSLALKDANLLSENVAVLKACLLNTGNSRNQKKILNPSAANQRYYPIAAANIVIEHCAQENVPGEAMDILELINRSDNVLVADTLTYLACLKSTKRMKNGPQIAEKIIDEMVQRKGEDFVTTEHLNSLLAAYARAGTEKYIAKAEDVFERIVKMRTKATNSNYLVVEEFEFITMLYAYSMVSDFKKVIEFYNKHATAFVSNPKSERKPRIFNAAIRATILEPRLFKNVETIEEVNNLRDMYKDMTERADGFSQHHQHQQQEEEEHSALINNNDNNRGNNAYLQKQTENALKMLTRVAADINAKAALISLSPSSSSSSPSSAKIPAKDDKKDDEAASSLFDEIDMSRESPTQARARILQRIKEYKEDPKQQSRALHCTNCSEKNVSAIQKLALDLKLAPSALKVVYSSGRWLRQNSTTINSPTTTTTSTTRVTFDGLKDCVFDKDAIDRWLSGL